MTEIKRYSLQGWIGGAEMKEDETGDHVKYTDHIAALNQQRRAAEKLAGELAGKFCGKGPHYEAICPDRYNKEEGRFYTKCAECNLKQAREDNDNG